jgi:hypothetical protein
MRLPKPGPAGQSGAERTAVDTRRHWQRAATIGHSGIMMPGPTVLSLMHAAGSVPKGACPWRAIVATLRRRGATEARALGVSPPARTGRPPSPVTGNEAAPRAVALDRENRKFAPGRARESQRSRRLQQPDRRPVNLVCESDRQPLGRGSASPPSDLRCRRGASESGSSACGLLPWICASSYPSQQPPPYCTVRKTTF